MSDSDWLWETQKHEVKYDLHCNVSISGATNWSAKDRPSILSFEHAPPTLLAPTYHILRVDRAETGDVQLQGDVCRYSCAAQKEKEERMEWEGELQGDHERKSIQL